MKFSTKSCETGVKKDQHGLKFLQINQQNYKPDTHTEQSGQGPKAEDKSINRQ